ncbi:MAG: hypothetical protein QM756_21500 [Polyangiaceae bacterium]
MTSTKTLQRALRIAPALLCLLGCELVADIETRSLGETPECKAYCDAVTQSCTGDNQQYASREVCAAVCRLLPRGDAEGSGNTLSCRSQRALSISAGEEATVCQVAGPASASPCTSQCESYCHLLLAACPARAQMLGLSEEECLRQCPALKPTGDFNATDEYVKGDTLSCRIYHLSVAALLPEQHCLHAFPVPKSPSEPCLEPPDDAPKCEDYCRIVGVACSGEHAVYENQSQCLAACGAFEQAGLLGKNSDTNGKTDVGSPEKSDRLPQVPRLQRAQRSAAPLSPFRAHLRRLLRRRGPVDLRLVLRDRQAFVRDRLRRQVHRRRCVPQRLSGAGWRHGGASGGQRPRVLGRRRQAWRCHRRLRHLSRHQGLQRPERMRGRAGRFALRQLSASLRACCASPPAFFGAPCCRSLARSKAKRRFTPRPPIARSRKAPCWRRALSCPRWKGFRRAVNQ